MTNEEVIRLILEVSGKEGLADLATKASAASDAMKDTSEAADNVKTSTGNAGRSMLELGRIAQDFSQGGIAGVINNVEGLVTSLGGTAGLAGVLTAVGVAFFVIKPHIQGFLDMLGESKDRIPESTDALERMSDAISRNKKELGELTEKEKLTSDELKRFNELTAENLRLQDQLSNARGAYSITEDDNEASRRRGGAFRKAVGEFGGGKALVEALVESGVDQKQAEEVISGGLKGRAIDIRGVGMENARFKEIYNQFDPNVDDAIKRNQEIEKEAADEKRKKDQEAAEQAKEAAKLTNAVGGTNDAIAGIVDRTLNKWENQGPRSDQIRQRAAMRETVQGVAEQNGVGLSMQQAQEAAANAQKIMGSTNISALDAAYLAVQQAVNNQMQMANRFQQIEQRFREAAEAGRNVNQSIMNRSR